MSGVKQPDSSKSTKGLIYGEPPLLRYRREPKEVEPFHPLICPTSGSMGLGMNQVVILRNEKFFKTNTRKARNTRNTRGRLLYPLVFFRLKKRNEKIEKIIETQERQETHTLARQGAFLPPFGPCFSLVFLSNESPTKRKRRVKSVATKYPP